MNHSPHRPTSGDPRQDTPRWPLRSSQGAPTHGTTPTPRPSTTATQTHEPASLWIVRVWLAVMALGGLALVRAAHLTMPQFCLAYFGGSLVVVGLSGLALMQRRHPIDPDPNEHDY